MLVCLIMIVCWLGSQGGLHTEAISCEQQTNPVLRKFKNMQAKYVGRPKFVAYQSIQELA